MESPEGGAVNVREKVLGSSVGYSLWKRMIGADSATVEFVRD